MDGYIVVRRTDKPFTAVSIDLNIEKTLMASLNGNGDLSHDRSFSELNSLLWLMSRPVTTKLNLNIRSQHRLTILQLNKVVLILLSKSENMPKMKKDRAVISALENYFTSGGLLPMTNKERR